MISFLFFILCITTGICITGALFPKLPAIAHLASSFLLGNFISGTLVYIISYALHPVSPYYLIYAVCAVMAAQLIGCFLIVFYKKYNSLSPIPKTAVVCAVILLFVGYYLMQKGISYHNGQFLIASNLYQDFGAHIPIIRSFSWGDNIPPMVPFFAHHPLTYHFMFDFLVAIYEYLGWPLVFSINLLSAFSFTSVVLLIFSISQELFGKNLFVGIISCVMFICNSSLSFIDVVKKYGLSLGSLSLYYHHNQYAGDGPFGKSVVSIFWNLNTYLNQRHLLFSMGVGIICVYCFLLMRRNKPTASFYIALSLLIGALPFWHSAVFISTIVLIVGILVWFPKPIQKDGIIVLLLALTVAVPQLAYIRQFSQTGAQFHPGFLATGNILTYWVYNVGLGIITIPIGFLLAPKHARIMLLPLLALFILPNFIQFSAQLFDNHKFFNIFILFANMYSAYALSLVWRKRAMFKVGVLAVLFFMTLSGMFDVLVIKNDYKASIEDTNNPFSSWLKKNTAGNDIFITNGDIYDPVTLAGRKTTTGRLHFAYLYGIPVGRDIEEQTNALSGIMSGKAQNYYVVLYTKEKEAKVLQPGGQPIKQFPLVYQDDTTVVYNVD